MSGLHLFKLTACALRKYTAKPSGVNGRKSPTDSQLVLQTHSTDREWEWAKCKQLVNWVTLCAEAVCTVLETSLSVKLQKNV